MIFSKKAIIHSNVPDYIIQYINKCQYKSARNIVIFPEYPKDFEAYKDKKNVKEKIFPFINSKVTEIEFNDWINKDNFFSKAKRIIKKMLNSITQGDACLNEISDPFMKDILIFEERVRENYLFQSYDERYNTTTVTSGWLTRKNFTKFKKDMRQD